MKALKFFSAYYYLGLIIGYFSKQDVISWVDQVIEKNNSFPYEFIELSLSNKKSLEDIASRLKKSYGQERIVEPLYKLLGELVTKLEEGSISDDDFFTYIFRIHHQGSAFDLEEKLSNKIDRLSDGYYLATEGIYGDIKTIREEAINELIKYKEFVGYCYDV